MPLRGLSKYFGGGAPGSEQAMNQFEYRRTENTAEALTSIAGKPHSSFLAGGTNLVDLMKLGVENPDELIDINRLPLTAVEMLPEGRIRIGALARNSDVAHHELIRSAFPALSQALLSGASPQLRNMATVGGNIMQRTRCYYFRDLTFACNKRAPGSGCPAMDGYNRIHAILGTSDRCIATNPSDMNVALVAFDSVIHVDGPRGKRSIQFEDFHLLPGETPDRETVLEAGELITSVEIPASPVAKNSLYIKVRDRASYEFALVSVALGLEMADGQISSSRAAFGGVGTKPWRAHAVEEVLRNGVPSEELFAKATEAAIEGVKPRTDNGFKVDLLKRTLRRALRTLAAGEKQ
jgi:xanthine dehydrogenase YagS FAD-binding subunit